MTSDWIFDKMCAMTDAKIDGKIDTLKTRDCLPYCELARGS